MDILKRTISSMIIFVAGLEIGGFGMWIITMSALKQPRYRHHMDYSRFRY